MKVDPSACRQSFVVYENTDKRPHRLAGLRQRSTFLEWLGLVQPVIHEWSDYNTVRTQTVRVPIGYRQISVPAEQRQRRYCGVRKKLVQQDNPVYDRIRALNHGAEVYAIHDNGGCPYIVYVNSDKNVRVYRKPSDRFIPASQYSGIFLDDRWMYIDLVLEVRAKNLWIDPTSPENERGNSMLLQLSSSSYLFIGESIYSFRLPATTRIVRYRSPIGNNDVPYPYAVDKQGNVYLLIEKVVVRGSLTDPYRFYYDDRTRGRPLHLER